MVRKAIKTLRATEQKRDRDGKHARDKTGRGHKLPPCGLRRGPPERRRWRQGDFEPALLSGHVVPPWRQKDSVPPIGTRIIDTEEPSCDLWLCGRRIGNYPCDDSLNFGAACPVCGNLFTVTFKWAIHWDFKHKGTSVTVSWLGDGGVHIPP